MKKERKVIVDGDNVKINRGTEEVQVSFKELSRTIGELTSGITEQIPDLSKQIANTFKSFFDNIDFSHLSEVQRVHIQNIMVMLRQGWNLEWYVGSDLVIDLLERYETLTEEYLFDEQIVKEYFEKNFETISNRAIGHPFYGNHSDLLLESKKLFKENRFAISSFPLFSAVDNLFTRWITNPEQFEIDTNTTYISGQKKKELQKHKEKYNPNQTLDISHLAIYSAYEGYLFYFKKSNNRNSLNRNIYMHGNYNYSLMDKTKCLKLWSFLILCIDFIEIMQRLREDEFKEA